MSIFKRASSWATCSRPKLFKRWIMLSTRKITIHWIAQLVSLLLIHWIVIYPADSAIHRFNNWGQVYQYVSQVYIWVIAQAWDQDSWILAKFFFGVLVLREMLVGKWVKENVSPLQDSGSNKHYIKKDEIWQAFRNSFPMSPNDQKEIFSSHFGKAFKKLTMWLSLGK